MRGTAASRSSPWASSSEAIRSSYEAADTHIACAASAIPIAACACAFDRITGFFASNSSTWRTDALVCALATFGLLWGVFAEPDAVSRDRERANDHVCVPTKGVGSRLRDLPAVPPTEFGGRL